MQKLTVGSLNFFLGPLDLKTTLKILSIHILTVVGGFGSLEWCFFYLATPYQQKLHLDWSHQRAAYKGYK